MEHTPMLDTGISIDMPDGESLFVADDDLREFIVRACNAYEALMKAARAARNELMMLGDPGSTAEIIIDQIDEALALSSAERE